MRISSQDPLANTAVAELPSSVTLTPESSPSPASTPTLFLDQMHHSPLVDSLDPRRLRFIQEVVSHAQEHLKHLLPYLDIRLISDDLPTTASYYLHGCYLRIKRSHGDSSRKELTKYIHRLNAVVNSYENGYGLFWIGHDTGDQQSITVRFNATDNLNKIASNPDIESLIESSIRSLPEIVSEPIEFEDNY